MNKQSQQLVIAGVVAFLTSGIITLAGLSAAQTPPPDGGMMHDGGTSPSGTSYTPPQDSGGTSYQQPSGTTSYPSHETNTAPVYQDSGTTHYKQPAGDWSRGTSTSTFTQPSGEYRMENWINDSTRVIDNKWDGQNFQKDGSNFHPGAPDFGGKTGAERGFRGGFEGKEGAEHEGGRFERKPMEGFDRTSGQGKEGVFGKGTSYPMKDGESKMMQRGGEGRFGGEEGGNALFEQWKKKGQEDREISEEDLAEIDDVLEDDESTITAEQALAYLKDATVEVKEFQGDLKDANGAVKELVTDDKKLDKLEAQVEKKYGDVEDAPPQVAAKVEDLATEVSEQKENLQGAIAAINSDIDESKARLEELKTELEDSGLKQAAALIKTCNTLLQKLDKVDTGFGKLEQKVEHVEVESHA